MRPSILQHKFLKVVVSYFFLIFLLLREFKLLLYGCWRGIHVVFNKQIHLELLHRFKCGNRTFFANLYAKGNLITKVKVSVRVVLFNPMERIEVG